MPPHFFDHFSGCLLGLAAGDALGTTLEFSLPGSFTPLTLEAVAGGLPGGGPFALKPGQWTDDTSMALCLAESLVERHGFDPRDQMERYVCWYRYGHLSSTGRCFDIGNTVRAALERYQHTGAPYCGSTDPNTAGNGSLMRLAPIPMYYTRQPEQAIERSGDSSRTTHQAPAAVDACRYYGALLWGALKGVDKETLLAERYCPLPGYWEAHPLVPKIDAVAGGSFKVRQPPQIRGSGYVVHALEAALWAFWHSTSFAEGALLAVNLGEDTDTTAAIYGQLAGAYYGAQAIPEAWRTSLALGETIQSLITCLYALA